MAELTLVEAINDCFHVELGRDENVMVMGEDVGRAGGVFRATAGLRDKFGPDRCVDTPLAEAGIMGTAVGLCMAGWRPVCEMQYDAFSYPALDQLITHVGRYRWRTGGKMEFPITVRMPYGGGVRAPELHDDSPEAYYVHTPGVKVAIPSTPSDAKGLLAAAIRDPDPVVIFEPKLHYRTMRGEVPEGEHVVPLGKARTVREGDDVTLVAYGSMVPLAEQAADALAGRGVGRGARHPHAEAARRGRAARVGREDRPRRDRPGGAAHVRLRRRARGDPRREGDPRPARPGAPRDRLRRAVPVLADRGRVHAVGRARRRRRRRSCSSTNGLHELPLERRYLHGHFSRDLEPVVEIDPGDSVEFSRAERAAGTSRATSSSSRGPRARRRATRSPGPISCAARGPARRSSVRDRRGRGPAPWGVTCTEDATTRSTGSSADGVGRALERFEIDARAVPRRAGHAAARAGRALDRSRRGAGAGTSTARSSSPGRRSTCRSRSTARSSRPATGTPRRATARSRGTRSSARHEAQADARPRDELALEWPVARIDDAWIDVRLRRGSRRGGADRDRRACSTLMGRELGLARRDALALASVGVDLRVTRS